MIARLLLVNAIALFVYMSAWFLVARSRNRLDLVDAAWGSGFALVAWLVVLQKPSGHSLLLALLVTIWSARLTYHIVERLRRRHDPRYEQMGSKWKGNYWRRAYGSVYMLQGCIVWVITIPIVLAGGSQDLPSATGFFAVAGTIIWILGFVIEAIADRQLRNFVVIKANKGKVMDRGLWSWSRHPNYFGELVLWYGISVFGFSAAYGYLGLIGPITLSAIIILVSGIPPIENRKKDDPEYQDYVRKTSVLIPMPPRL
jgi:steroid 5-alpha reductase family enzyme